MKKAENKAQFLEGVKGEKPLERHGTALVREVEGRLENCSVLDSNGRNSFEKLSLTVLKLG